MVNIESLRPAFEVWLDSVLSTEALLCFQEKHLCIFCDGNTFYISDMPPPPTDHAEFARCPQPLPMGSPSLPVSSCELNKNTRRCHQQPLATHLSCRLYQTCDHAVLISGRTVYIFVFTKWLKHTGLWLKVNMSSGSVASPRGLLRDVLMPRVWIYCSRKRDDQ